LPFTKPEDAVASTEYWDVALTDPQVTQLMAQLAAMPNKLRVICIKCHRSQTDAVKDALEASQAHMVVYIFFWEKVDQNVNGTHKMVSSFEFFVLAIDRELVASDEYWQDMSVNPLDRHCTMYGRCLQKYVRDASGNKVNKSQTPTYFSYAIAKRFFPPSLGTIFVGCSGTGSDVLGFNAAGFNVVGMDKHETMYTAGCDRVGGIYESISRNSQSAQSRPIAEQLVSYVNREGKGCWSITEWNEHQAHLAEIKAQALLFKEERKEEQRKRRLHRQQVQSGEAVERKCVQCKKSVSLPEEESECYICNDPIHPGCAKKGSTEYDMDFLYCPRQDCLNIQLNPDALWSKG